MILINSDNADLKMCNKSSVTLIKPTKVLELTKKLYQAIPKFIYLMVKMESYEKQ